ncbi:MAG: ankyrin repeat domain-containing protein [Gammaproteobacteria bacterium]|nr:ankyrin repeat domain-containing protein [Gammaproteobacteria bacterium]
MRIAPLKNELLINVEALVHTLNANTDSNSFRYRGPVPGNKRDRIAPVASELIIQNDPDVLVIGFEKNNPDARGFSNIMTELKDDEFARFIAQIPSLLRTTIQDALLKTPLELVDFDWVVAAAQADDAEKRAIKKAKLEAKARREAQEIAAKLCELQQLTVPKGSGYNQRLEHYIIRTQWLYAIALIARIDPIDLNTRKTEWHKWDVCEYLGDTILIKAIIYQAPIEVFTALFTAGAQPNTENASGFPLHLAISKIKSVNDATAIAIVICLLEHGADFNKADAAGNTALHLAAQHGNTDLMTCLKNKGANLSIRNTSEQTPYVLAARNANYASIMPMLTTGEAEEEKSDLIDFLILDGKIDMLFEFFPSGKFSLKADHKGRTVLHDLPDKEERNKHLERLLPRLALTSINAAIIDKYTKDEVTPLIISLFRPNAEAAKLLLQHGANPNIGQFNSKSALIFTIKENCPVLVEYLLNHGADPRQTDSCGNNALHTYLQMRCIPRNDSAIWDKLVTPETINAVNKDGNSPLHLILMSESPDTNLIKRLLMAGAKKNAYNNINLRPIDLLRKHPKYSFLRQKLGSAFDDAGDESVKEATAYCNP